MRSGRALCAYLLMGGALLVGCSPVEARTPDPVNTGAYTGPWAGTFAEWADMTESSFALGGFQDSTITDSERAEGLSLIEECYRSRGYAVEYDQYGFETVTSTGGTEDSAEVMGECAFADGGVVALHDMITANPNNDDMLALVADCLVREGLVEPGFSRDDLEATEIIPGAGVAGSPGERCQRDPLGLVSVQP